jgi:hypothetical protein
VPVLFRLDNEMKKLLAVLLFLRVLSAAPGQVLPDSYPDEQSQRTTLEVKPGPPVIKQKDLWDGTGYIHPFVRMPKYILQDQEAIWSSPLHTAKQDVKWWAIFGGATAALIATDQWSVKQLPNSTNQVSVSTWGSRFGVRVHVGAARRRFLFRRNRLS